jgi:hypothetical protein
MLTRFDKDSTTDNNYHIDIDWASTESAHYTIHPSCNETITFNDSISLPTVRISHLSTPYECHKDKIIEEYLFAYYIFKSYEQVIKDRFYRLDELRKSILRLKQTKLILRVRDVIKKQGRKG